MSMRKNDFLTIGKCFKVVKTVIIPMKKEKGNARYLMRSRMALLSAS